MNKQVILDRFNVEGIFPSDSELEVLAGSPIGTGGTIETFGVEMDLLELAEGDVNHPYHEKTLPGSGFTRHSEMQFRGRMD